ncbi:MAG: hypothetical protein CMB99_14860 [Flavobacteriaceae bacterium]|nr:hypothetical protein [Flavobacteriaceae bacterium]|tara:strand:- start:265560 stop:265853 length:294 start_codon:yes stop_codon:yes gene_type:complete
MSGVWGSYKVLINRQEFAKKRKAEMRDELRKRKEKLIKSKTKGKFIEKKVSKSELKVIKGQIRLKYRRQRILEILLGLLVLVIILWLTEPHWKVLLQ